MISFDRKATANQNLVYQRPNQSQTLYSTPLSRMARNVSYVISLLFILFLFSACSGGEGGTGVTPFDISHGQITGFGSIFVNGVEFDTTNVAISLEGISGSNTDLKLGMVVTVKGTINADGITGTADTVSVEEVIMGLVQTNDGMNTLTVLDQTIQVPANARFDGVADITGLTPNVDFVEISGYVKDSGVISAVRIELLGAGQTESKLFGNITNLDIASIGTFKVGSTLIVDYASANISGFSNNTLSNNAFVKIKGSYNAPSNTLTATSVENALVSDIDVDKIEIEGFVTSIISATNFFIGGTEVQVDVNTVYDGGAVDEIFTGMFLEAEGALVEGILIAEEIEFEDKIRIEAEIANVDTVANTITLTGLAGLVINLDSFTEFSSDLLPGGMNSLTTGSMIRIRAFQEDTNLVIARRIDTQFTVTNISLQGFVSAVTTPSTTFDLMNVAIDTTSFLDSDFTKENVAIGRTAYFAELQIDKIVEAKGTLNGAIINWASVEIID